MEYESFPGIVMKNLLYLWSKKRNKCKPDLPYSIHTLFRYLAWLEYHLELQKEKSTREAERIGLKIMLCVVAMRETH